MVRQLVRRHIGRVIDRSSNNRTIGIPFKKLDDNFLANTRPKMRYPTRSRPRLGHANPARAVLVTLAFSIPVKLNAHASVRVETTVLALLHCDSGSVGSSDGGLGS